MHSVSVRMRGFVASLASAARIGIAFFLVASGSAALAATLAAWDVNGLPGGANNFGASPFAPTTVAANITVGGLTRAAGVGVTGTAAARAWGGNDWQNGSAASAVTGNDFATFTVTANAGYQVSFNSIPKFDYRRSGTGPATGVVQVQVGGGAFVDIATVSFSSSSSSGGSIAPIDLSGVAALQNVPAGTTVTFRFANYGGTSSGGTWYIFDVGNNTTADFQVDGTVSAIGPVNGACGSANGQSLFAAPTANLCSTGTSSAVTGSGPWAWSCNGANGGSAASCSASLNTSGLTPIYTIQGSGSTSPLAGASVTTSGVVTKVNNNGFYLQDPAGDGNPLTSDGIFVFTNTAPTVAAGQAIVLTGTVSEFNTGAPTNATTLARTLTELVNPTGIAVTGSGTITPTPVTLPLANADDMERYEGMLVTITSPLTASQNFFQGRYGQVTLSAGGRLYKPTNLYAAGSANAIALQSLNARSTIMLDDGTSLQNPNPTPFLAADSTLRAGDTLPSGITGVIDYGLATSSNTGLAMYRIHPTVAPVFIRSNPRTAAPPAVGGNLKVASFNVLNFFTTFTNGQTADGQTGQGCSLGASVAAANCRGADDLAEFNRQRAKIVAAMAAINADVFGLMEIQNNGNAAAQNLVDALNIAVGAGTYAVAPLPSDTGTDAIRVAIIYKPATLSPYGAAMSDTSAIHNRPPLAQTFSANNGERFSVVVNHFKSKGSCPGDLSLDDDQNDGQGCWNDRRKQQSQALLTFIGSVQAAAGDPDVMVIGDLNAYGAEDPINILTGAGLVNQVSRFNALGYSYVFDGEAGYLDHALATPSLSAQISAAAHWHVNADEPSIIDYNLEFKQPDCGTCGPDYYAASPYRASDHDPVLIGINLQPPAAAQVILFDALADRRLDQSPFTLLASASSGLTVTFSSLTPAVCGVSGTSVTLAAVGTCTVAANQAGNAAFSPAPQVTRSFTVTALGLVQTISFAPIAQQVVGTTFAVAPVASSGLPVALVSDTPAVCATTGTNVTLTGVGGCTLRAQQPGDAVYLPAPDVTRSFSIVATGTGGGDEGDVPLPAWALLLLAAALGRGLVRRTALVRNRVRD